jgi:hypothetical protein
MISNPRVPKVISPLLLQALAAAHIKDRNGKEEHAQHNENDIAHDDPSASDCRPAILAAGPQHLGQSSRGESESHKEGVKFS